MVSWAVAAGLAVASQHPWIQLIEGQAQSVLLKLRPTTPPPDQIVILAIDEYSLSQGELYQADPQRYPFLAPLATWPWPRQVYATAIERLMAAGATAVGIDILLVDPSVYGPADDAQLQAALNQYGPQVALAAAYDVATSDFGVFTKLLRPVYDGSAQVGLINVTPDADQVFRPFPDQGIGRIRQDHDFPDQLPSFSRAVLMAAGQADQTYDSHYLYFYGPSGTFPSVSFVQVLDPHNWDQFAPQFRDKIVLIGPTAATFQDQLNTPIDPRMSGIEFHANAVAAMLEGRKLDPWIIQSGWRGLAIGTGLALLGLGLGYGLLKPFPRLMGFLGAAIGWGGMGYLVMVHGQRLMPVAVPVAALGMGGMSYIVTGAVSDRLEERRLRRTLERYVAPSVVEEILNQPEDFNSLTMGHRLRAAVLFSDIRGFTSLSYQLGAEDTVKLLNTYLEAMVTAILTCRGTVDKFIGDAVMAEFGSPTSQGAVQDALYAVQAALLMRQSLAELRVQLQASGLPPLYHGIGISYGDLVAGNIGSIKRLEYTAIGDTVNVASRVEGLTKVLGTDILITDPLYQLVRDQIVVVDHGHHLLAGRQYDAVQVYGVVSLVGESDALYHQVQQELQAHLQILPPPSATAPVEPD